MRRLISKSLILISLLGFFMVGILLYLNHPGFAIKVVNYLYFVLLIGVIIR